MNGRHWKRIGISIGQIGMLKTNTAPSQSQRSSTQARSLVVSANPTEIAGCVVQLPDWRQLSLGVCQNPCWLSQTLPQEVSWERFCALKAWLRHNKIPTISVLCQTGSILEGKIFCICTMYKYFAYASCEWLSTYPAGDAGQLKTLVVQHWSSI